jgi:hypothetical protein
MLKTGMPRPVLVVTFGLVAVLAALLGLLAGRA